ncbi:hypothetical protein DQ04_03511060 [Trypanosoma grayi]|uniref:hypothetical protein n=1 Tax=Trypanosoma grayi TaxID=71804 RepID=UPI0004F49C59|nr:hypothetical protein DQ04_03511060 [Trypanosoma grayi]KEG10614.1 hypothetical protein DQ04_03511060 [Trypanosoma grayi]
MSTETGAEGEKEEERWSRLMVEEGERMKAYASAMHTIATRYWDTHEDKKDDDDQPSSPAAAVNCIREKRPRDTGSEGSVGQQVRHVCEPSQHSDRVEYSLQCLADYYLGVCSLSALTGRQQQQSGDNSSFGRKNGEGSLTNHEDTVFERLPRIVTSAVKAWRREFYTANGRQASAAEVEAAAYHILLSSKTPKGEECTRGMLSNSLPRKNELPTYIGHGSRWLAAQLAATYMSMSRNQVRRRRRYLCCRSSGGTGSAGCSSNDSGGDGDVPLEPLPLQVLDVGSCYGPFKGMKITNGVLRVPLAVTALDLCPYEGSDVIQGDWLAARFYDVETAEDVKRDDYDDGSAIGGAITAGMEQLVRTSENTCSDEETPEKYFSVARGQFDAVLFCLMLSFLPHPRLRYRACLHAHLALKDGGLFIIVSTRTQGSRRSSWIDDWIACIEGIGFTRVHKNIMGQIVGLSFRKVTATEDDGDTGEWLQRMMARPEAESGLRIIGDDCM